MPFSTMDMSQRVLAVMVKGHELIQQLFTPQWASPWSSDHNRLPSRAHLGDGLPKTAMQCQHFLMLAAPNMSLKCVLVAAHHVTELAVVLSRLAILGDGLLLLETLLVVLTFQMSLVRLWRRGEERSRYFPHQSIGLHPNLRSGSTLIPCQKFGPHPNPTSKVLAPPPIPYQRKKPVLKRYGPCYHTP